MKHKLNNLWRLLRYDILRFVRNLFVYRKALWNTYNFDYSGSLHYLKIHLEQLEPVIANGYHLHGDKTAKKIQTCRLLLERILDFSEQYSLYEIDAEFEGRKLKFVHTPKGTEHPRKGTKIYNSVVKDKEDQDWNLLMKLLHKHQRSFWD